MPGRARLANDAWESLLTAHAEMMRQLAAEDVWNEVSRTEYDVLYTLSKCRGPIRLSELNRRVLLSQPALSRMVERLVERGLVRREADEADGRSIRLSLTEAGAGQQKSTGRRHALNISRAMNDAFEPAEMRELLALCRKLAANREAALAEVRA
ncbi:MAG TPA: MarR family transcriptional regulator [Solirubrobacterales bacterium]|jgi:DNA-binding MarR family transcriptional regulator|nr:MarR family transcriptional regulator [Solirubrobacterales bacterium]